MVLRKEFPVCIQDTANLVEFEKKIGMLIEEYNHSITNQDVIFILEMYKFKVMYNAVFESNEDVEE